MKSHYPNCQLGDQCNCAEHDEPQPDETPTSKTVEFIREYNRWRRGDESVCQPSPHQIGIALDEVCELVESLERELNEVWAARERLSNAITNAAGVLSYEIAKHSGPPTNTSINKNDVYQPTD